MKPKDDYVMVIETPVTALRLLEDDGTEIVKLSNGWEVTFFPWTLHPKDGK